MLDLRDSRKRDKQIPYIFLLVSLLVHAVFVLLLPYLDLLKFKKEESTIVEIDPSLLEEFSKKKEHQIVETEKVNNSTPPKETKYMGEKNQTVEQEKRAAKVDTFQAGKSKAGEKLSLKNLVPESMKKPLSEGDEFLQKPEVEKQMAQKGGPLASTNDYLKDVKEGDSTLLNTKEFIYYAYYHRIRQKLEQSWNSRLRNAITSYASSGRKLIDDHSYVTRLVVILDRQGKITAVKVLEESGARDLDDAAVEAFNRAGPFPNPPKGLVDKDGLIKIRWDFILQS